MRKIIYILILINACYAFGSAKLSYLELVPTVYLGDQADVRGSDFCVIKPILINESNETITVLTRVPMEGTPRTHNDFYSYNFNKEVDDNGLELQSSECDYSPVILKSGQRTTLAPIVLRKKDFEKLPKEFMVTYRVDPALGRAFDVWSGEISVDVDTNTGASKPVETAKPKS